MKKVILIIGSMVLTGTTGIIGVLWSYSLRPYSIKQLEDITVTQSGLTFRIPLESAYYPALIQYERKDGAVVVTIFKQLAIGPFKGIWWTPTAAETLLQVIPKYDSNTKRISARTHAFGISNPKFILRTLEGDSPLPVTEIQR